MTEKKRTRSGRGASAAEPDEPGTLKKSLAKLMRKLEDQSQRIDALARGREAGMTAMNELRDELALVARERDELRRRLTELEGMQTETLTLDESDLGDDADAYNGTPPSIDDLMATFSGAEGALGRASHSTARFDPNDGESTGEWKEMISPELIVLGSGKDRSARPSERYLVRLEAGEPVKCPLDQDLMTIGRSESADIQVDGDFISRIHARILRIRMDTVIEDAGSKNGTRVNAELVKRQVLNHGDVVRIGSATFRFVDPAIAQGESG
jgi:hypothetical protein